MCRETKRNTAIWGGGVCLTMPEFLDLDFIHIGYHVPLPGGFQQNCNFWISKKRKWSVLIVDFFQCIICTHAHAHTHTNMYIYICIYIYICLYGGCPRYASKPIAQNTPWDKLWATPWALNRDLFSDNSLVLWIGGWGVGGNCKDMGATVEWLSLGLFGEACVRKRLIWWFGLAGAGDWSPFLYRMHGKLPPNLQTNPNQSKQPIRGS